MAASGAPERRKDHAELIANVALTMIREVKEISVPSGKGVDIRIGL